MALKHLKGLNTLRFFAASLVLFDHARHHLNEMGILFAQSIPILHKGVTAVNFFFTLSGFLISYLAINEINEYGKVNFKFFYIRRVLRIFPLYYLVFFIMFCLVGIVVPIVLNESLLGFPMWQGGMLYVFMLPNLVKAIWPDTVGGLNILWSIGVEEQFYLLFPVVILAIKNRASRLQKISLITIGYFVWYWLLRLNIFGFNASALQFLETLKFHYMLVGILFAVLCHNYMYGKEASVVTLLINNKIFQSVLFILALLIFVLPINENILIDLLSSIVFALLIVTVSHRKKGIINYNIKFLSYFGVISYGIYLLHPMMSYFLRFVVLKFDSLNSVLIEYPWLYLVVLLLITLFSAHISYTFYEKRFLRLKQKFVKK